MKCTEVKAAEALHNIKAKMLLARVSAFILVVLTIALVLDPSWEIAVVQAILGPTSFRVIRHYFTIPETPAWLKALTLLLRRSDDDSDESP